MAIKNLEPVEPLLHCSRMVSLNILRAGCGGLKYSHGTHRDNWIPEIMVTTATGRLSFFIQDPIFRSKLKPTKIWSRLARMQEMQREKATPKTGRPTMQETLVGLPVKLNVREKQASKEKSSKKHK